MDRRAFVSSLPLVVAGGVGCLDRPELRARMAYVWLQNDRDESYDVDVVIEDAGETVFSRTYTLGTGPDTATVTEDRPVEGAGQYVVSATMDGETREVDTRMYVDGDEDCVGTRFSLLDNGSVDYWVKSVQEC